MFYNLEMLGRCTSAIAAAAMLYGLAVATPPGNDSRQDSRHGAATPLGQTGEEQALGPPPAPLDEPQSPTLEPQTQQQLSPETQQPVQPQRTPAQQPDRQPQSPEQRVWGIQPQWIEKELIIRMPVVVPQGLPLDFGPMAALQPPVLPQPGTNFPGMPEWARQQLELANPARMMNKMMTQAQPVDPGSLDTNDRIVPDGQGGRMLIRERQWTSGGRLWAEMSQQAVDPTTPLTRQAPPPTVAPPQQPRQPQQPPAAPVTPAAPTAPATQNVPQQQDSVQQPQTPDVQMKAMGVGNGTVRYSVQRGNNGNSIGVMMQSTGGQGMTGIGASIDSKNGLRTFQIRGEVAK